MTEQRKYSVQNPSYLTINSMICRKRRYQYQKGSNSTEPAVGLSYTQHILLQKDVFLDWLHWNKERKLPKQKSCGGNTSSSLTINQDMTQSILNLTKWSAHLSFCHDCHWQKAAYASACRVPLSPIHNTSILVPVSISTSLYLSIHLSPIICCICLSLQAAGT